MDTMNLQEKFLASKYGLDPNKIGQHINMIYEYDEFAKKERMKSFISDSLKKPSWVWNSCDIGWFEFIQDFDKIKIGIAFDSAIHEPKNRPLLSVDFLFWNMTIQFGK